jgi:hypothetical protein
VTAIVPTVIVPSTMVSGHFRLMTRLGLTVGSPRPSFDGFGSADAISPNRMSLSESPVTTCFPGRLRV